MNKNNPSVSLFLYESIFRRWLGILALLSIQAFGQDTANFQLPQVVVSSSRFSLSPLEMNRSVTVIDSSSFHAASPLTLDEALQLFTTTELRRRGTLGVQTDIGIRGSTFSQQAVLINGIRINDPQTAHHNFDIPVSMGAVKQIEIIRGPSSSHVGPDAFGGIVNIVTSNENHGTAFDVSAGQFGYRSGNVSTGFSAGDFSSFNSVQYAQSDGYRYDTEAKTFAVSTANSLRTNGAKIQFVSGYSSKDFGAYDFYSPGSNIPSHEKTQTLLNTAGIDFSASGWNLSSHISYRHHYDHFIFDIRSPARSDNQHNTNLYIADLNGTRALSSELLLTSAAEITTDNINSTNLGIHSRTYAAFSSVVRWVPLPPVSIDAGFRGDVHSDYGTLFHPIVNAGYFFAEHHKLYISAGTSFRSPSYTDLYYKDPKTVGNANLKPERGVSFETGIQSQPLPSWSFQLSGFLRQQSNLIDYIENYSYYGDSLFHADNFTEAAVHGIELQSSWIRTNNTFFIQQAFIGYTFIESNLNTKNAVATRYSLTHPKHQINGALLFEILPDFFITAGGTYAHRTHYPDQTVFDLTVKKKIEFIECIVKATNVFNQPYQEIPGIPLPGRWITGTVRMTID